MGMRGVANLKSIERSLVRFKSEPKPAAR